MKIHLIFASLLLIVPYLLPLWPARRLPADSRLLVSFALGFRALLDCAFQIPSYIVECWKNDSPALHANLYFIVLVNLFMAMLIWFAIARGARTARKSGGFSLWQDESIYFAETHLLVLASIFLVAYIFLTHFVAITNPRLAYQDHRRGIGFIWAGFISLSTLWMIVRIFNRRPLLTTFLIYAVFCYLSGSKGVIASAVVPFLANPRKSNDFRIKLFLVAVPISIVAFLYLFGQFTASQSLMHRLSVYFDMFHQSVRVFEDYLASNFQFQWGKIYFSWIWQFVPRAIYPDKPFAWGTTVLVEKYYPGMAQTGHTPSFGIYTSDFADFGWLGFLSAVLNFEFVVQLFSMYVLSSGWSRNRKIYLICFSVLLAPSIYFHLPLILAISMAYLLLFIKEVPVQNTYSVN